jgi:hypothetical protein
MDGANTEIKSLLLVQVHLSQWLSTLSIQHLKAVHTSNSNSAHVGSKDKWVRDLDIHIENEEWKYVYMLPFRSSIDTNLRYVQYRILQRILTTNRFLFIIKVVDLDRCSLL